MHAGPDGDGDWTRLIGRALLVLLPLVVFSNVYENGYHLDDHYRIVGNAELEEVWPPTRHFFDPATSATLPHLVQFRPLLPLSLSIDFAVADALGVDRRAMLHGVAVALHVVSSLLVFSLLAALLGRGGRSAAWFAAACFAVHPVSGVPVNYLCARDLLLMQLFLLAGLRLWVHARSTEGGPLAYLPATACFLLSIFSKTNAVVAPALLLALDVTCFRSRLLQAGTWLRALPGIVASVFFVAWTRFALNFSDLETLDPSELGRGPLEYPLTQLEVHLFHYLRNVVWPFRLRPLPDVEPVTTWLDAGALLGLAVIVGSLVLAWRARRRAPVVTWCIASYWILFSLTSSVVPLRSLATDYRQYPSLPFLFGAVALTVRGLGSRLLPVVGACAIAWFAVSAWFMNRVWLDGESLWGQSVRYGGTAQAHMNYGTSLMASDLAEAERHLLIALERSPINVYARINLGIVEVRTGRVEQGFATLERAVADAPAWGITHYWYARTLAEQGRHTEAAAAARRAVEVDPRNATYRAYALEANRRFDDAADPATTLEQATFVLSVEPNDVPALYRAAMATYRSSRAAESLDYLERLHALVPSYEESLFLEGYLLQEAGRRGEALACYERFLAEHPEHVQATFNRAHALMLEERWGEAEEGFARTLELRPEYDEARRHLERCRAARGGEGE